MCTWSDTLKHKLFLLCWVIILVLNELSPHTGLDSDGFISSDNDVQIQIVLMVRTRNESGLSEPINLEQALPLARPDVTSHDGIDAIQVTLATTVQFIVRLQRREEQVILDLALDLAVNTALCPYTEYEKINSPRITEVSAWIDHIMELADGKGLDNVDNVKEAWDAVLRVKAAQRGESCDAK